jgi:hypothetical protein
VCCCYKRCVGWRSCWVEWSKRSRLAHLVEALVHAPVTTDRKTRCGPRPLCHYPAHDDVTKDTDGNDISICTTEEMEKYESLWHREFAHTRVYNVNLLERVGLDEELPTILRAVSWGKLYNEPRLCSCLLTLEFLMTIETVWKNRKPFVKFRLFEKSFGCDFSHFSELLDFSKSCLPKSSAMRN